MYCVTLIIGLLTINLVFVPCQLSAIVETTFNHDCDKSIAGHALSSMETSSMIDCLILCLKNTACQAVTYSQDELKANGKTNCNLKYVPTERTPYEIVTSPGTCYASRDLPADFFKVLPETITTSSETTNRDLEETTTSFPDIIISTEQSTSYQATVTSSNRSYIIGAVETVQNVCGPYSYFDVALLTLDGVYLYDSVSDLYSLKGPCKPVQLFSDIFNAYSDLPDITDIDAVMSFNTDRVEIYANNKVWSIVFSGTQQYTLGGYPMTYGGHLRLVTGQVSLSTFPEKPEWGTLRSYYGTQERYFKENGIINYYANFLPFYTEIIDPEEDVLNVNNVNINPWTILPDNTVEVMLSPSQHADYIVLTSDLQCYLYKMDYTGSNTNNPAITLIHKGDILF